MFSARSDLGGGKTLLVFGLSQRNRELLEAGKPLSISRDTHGMAIPENLKILIFAGETEASMQATMQAYGLIGPDTVIDQFKPQ